MRTTNANGDGITALQGLLDLLRAITATEPAGIANDYGTVRIIYHAITFFLHSIA